MQFSVWSGDAEAVKSMGDVIRWFDSSGNAAFAGFVVAMVSLVVSASAIALSVRANRTANRAQQRQLEIEEVRERDRVLRAGRAELRARINRDRTGRTVRDTLVVENFGESEARRVSVMLDDLPLREHPVCANGQRDPDFIGSGAIHEYLLGITQDLEPRFNITITWQDDSGDTRRFRTTLTA